MESAGRERAGREAENAAPKAGECTTTQKDCLLYERSHHLVENKGSAF
jgi:hypothetical protein